MMTRHDAGKTCCHSYQPPSITPSSIIDKPVWELTAGLQAANPVSSDTEEDAAQEQVSHIT